MDKLEKYQQILQGIILRYAKLITSDDQILVVPICDAVRNEYLLMNVGWDEKEHRSHHIIFHFRLYNDKVYVEEDSTDVEIVRQLVEAGIPKEDIVLAFYPPSHRQITEFAFA